METEKSFEWLFHQISLNANGVSLAEWKEMTGDGFSFFEDFLKATGKLADQIPCPLFDPYSGCEGMFVVGKYGYCSSRYDRNGQKKGKSSIEPADDLEYHDYTVAYLEHETHCDVMAIDSGDLQFFDFDFKAFWKSAIENSRTWRDVSFNYGIGFMHPNGLYEVGICENDEIKKYRLFFLLTWSRDSLSEGIDYLTNCVEGKYALIVPSSFNENARNKINSISTGSVIINLDDILKYDDDDGFIYENEVGIVIEKSLDILHKLSGNNTIAYINNQDEMQYCKNKKYIFHYIGNKWKIVYKGIEFELDYNFRHLSIVILLANPRKEMTVSDLHRRMYYEHVIAKPKTKKAVNIVNSNKKEKIPSTFEELCNKLKNKLSADQKKILSEYYEEKKTINISHKKL